MSKMKSVIIYGVGLRCKYILDESSLFQSYFKNENLEVIGFSDSDSQIKNKIFYDNKFYDVMPREKCTPEQTDYIIITSNKYFREIRRELIEKGFKQECILQLDSFVDNILNNIYHKEMFLGKAGVEIGGPSFIFQNLYKICLSCDGVDFCTETVWKKKCNAVEYYYCDKKLGKTFISDAVDMKIIDDNSYDFILSSNNLEHIANPLKALKEFYRIVKPDGLILVAVPQKEKTFDHNREYTPFEHILSDYIQDVQENDLTHLNEILELHDLDMDKQAGDFESFKKRSINNLQNRCLHHHVFSPKCLVQMYEYMGLDIIQLTNIFGNYIILGKIGKIKERKGGL